MHYNYYILQGRHSVAGHAARKAGAYGGSEVGSMVGHLVGPPVIGGIVGNLVGESLGESAAREMGLDKTAARVRDNWAALELMFSLCIFPIWRKCYHFQYCHFRLPVSQQYIAGGGSRSRGQDGRHRAHGHGLLRGREMHVLPVPARVASSPMDNVRVGHQIIIHNTWYMIYMGTR